MTTTDRQDTQPDEGEPTPPHGFRAVDLSVWIAAQDVRDLAQYARQARLVHGSFGRFLVDGP
ncbi:hypothetical protein [Actinomycetospora aeridis]|uniref:Uncharacterized protein n=1 Tax=Actinomycetospora aeridis TaxID=3129231 RepID=A0ABU8NE72_9PSEU